MLRATRLIVETDCKDIKFKINKKIKDTERNLYLIIFIYVIITTSSKSYFNLLLSGKTFCKIRN